MAFSSRRIRTLKLPTTAAILLALAALCGACDDGSSEGMTLGADAADGSSANTDAGGCAVRCQAVATKCESPANMCTDMCKSVTESQLACVEASPCSMTAMQLCFLPSDAGNDTSSSDAGTDSSSDASADATTDTGKAD